MKKLENLLWSIPAIGTYFYAATVLTNYGFVSYFNIPSNFVSASLSDNIIFFYQYFVASAYLAGHAKWYAWLTIVLIVGIIVALCYVSDIWKGVFTAIGTIFMLFWLGSFYRLGQTIAINSTIFLIPTAGCPPIGPAAQYIVPITGDGQGVFVPINASNTMTGGFILKNLADLDCTLENKNIGKVAN